MRTKLIGLVYVVLVLFALALLFLKSNICTHHWKVGVATWKYEQYLERADALGPYESSYYECIKCGKIRISGQRGEDIFEPTYPKP